MIPELSMEYVPGTLLYPDEVPRRNLIDYELGGVAIQDPSQGLQVQAWKCFYNKLESKVYVTPMVTDPNTAIELFEESGIVELSIAFDQNMRWLCVYVLNTGQCKLRWYDASIGNYAIRDMGMEIISPMLAMDDKRAQLVSDSDVLLTYITKSKKLCVRAQRERFNTEHVLKTDIKGRIYNFGMTNKLRLEWQIFDFETAGAQSLSGGQ